MNYFTWKAQPETIETRRLSSQPRVKQSIVLETFFPSLIQLLHLDSAMELAAASARRKLSKKMNLCRKMMSSKCMHGPEKNLIFHSCKINLNIRLDSNNKRRLSMRLKNLWACVMVALNQSRGREHVFKRSSWNSTQQLGPMVHDEGRRILYNVAQSASRCWSWAHFNASF